jgi:hypothetical protein
MMLGRFCVIAEAGLCPSDPRNVRSETVAWRVRMVGTSQALNPGRMGGEEKKRNHWEEKKSHRARRSA